MARVVARRSLPILLAIKVLLALVVLVYAATMTVTVVQRSGEKGTQLSVTNNLVSVDKGFSKAGSGITAAGTSCASNITYTGSPRTANTAVTGGNIVYDVQVNTTATASTSTCFTVKLLITSNTGSQTTYGPVYIATGTTVTAGQTIDCKFDLATTSLPASPFSFKITVQ